MAIGFAPAALRDLEAIGDYIHADDPTAALRFVAALTERCGKLAQAPRGGRQRPEMGQPGLRSVPFQRYVIFYTCAADDVRIERVLHGARDIESLFDRDGPEQG
jgi:toxin ParE1/3/4